jgi:hypothetical protein
MKIQVFIAGIIQGSNRNLDIHEQDYRDSIQRILEQQIPDAEIYCPLKHHPNSVFYDDSKAEEVFQSHLARIRQSHVLIVYLPEASLGSSIEMWEARKQDRLILTISPMTTNWVVRILSDAIFSDLQQFEDWTQSGGLRRAVEERYSTLMDSSQ